MMKATSWIYLSHLLDSQTPIYGGGEGLQAVQVRSVAQGESCNCSLWTLSNHLGTHIDFPLHFTETGSGMDDYSADFWRFRRVQLCEIDRVEPGGDYS